MLRHVLVLGAALAVSAAPGTASSTAIDQTPAVQQAAPAAPQAPLSDAQMEEFLRKARVVRTKTTDKGVTGSLRAELSDGVITHDAHIQTIDESKVRFEARDKIEFNFRDNWRFNVAAYKLDRTLGLHLVPVSVDRGFRGKGAAFTWWVDDVLMDEGQRMKQNVQPPDSGCWSEQMRFLRLFDQLIDNIDRNVGNILITKDWRLWAIDHTRAFRFSKTMRKPDHITRIDRALLAKLKGLEFRALEAEVGRYITDIDIRNILSRRDAMVAYYESRGEAALFERRPVGSGCVSSARRAESGDARGLQLRRQHFGATNELPVHRTVRLQRPSLV